MQCTTLLKGLDKYNVHAFTTLLKGLDKYSVHILTTLTVLECIGMGR